MKNSVKILGLFTVAIFFITTRMLAQQSPKELKAAAIKDKVTNQSFTFNAQYALPLRGGQKYLSPDYYDLKIVKDSVIAYLPFYGRVYMDPPLNPDDAGIKFTSTKFAYKSVPRKKGGWTITIIPNDTKFASKLLLDVFPNGTAYLQVSSNTRDQMSFNGYIKEEKK